MVAARNIQEKIEGIRTLTAEEYAAVVLARWDADGWLASAVFCEATCEGFAKLGMVFGRFVIDMDRGELVRFGGHDV